MAGDRFQFITYSDDNRGTVIKSDDQKNKKSNGTGVTNGNVVFDSPVDNLGRQNCNFLFRASQYSDHMMYSVSKTKRVVGGHSYYQMSGRDANFRIRCRIPVIPGFRYRITTVGYKYGSNSTYYGYFYVGADSLDANFNPIRKDKAGTFNYGGALATRMNKGQFRYSNIMEGYNSTSQNSHQKFDPGAKYFDLYVLASHQSKYSSTGRVDLYGINVQLDFD